MSDKELLELAAKAAGIEGEWSRWHQSYGDLWVEGLNTGGPILWNPLNIETGDALRLAVKLGISITPYPIYQHENRHSVITKQRRTTDTLREINPTEIVEVYGDDPYAATCRAILRAAAEIGRGME